MQLIRYLRKEKYYEFAIFFLFFQTVLAPTHWSENMTTEIPDKECKLFKSVVQIPIEKSEVHYISLLPQQELAASTLNRQIITQL